MRVVLAILALLALLAAVVPFIYRRSERVQHACRLIMARARLAWEGAPPVTPIEDWPDDLERRAISRALVAQVDDLEHRLSWTRRALVLLTAFVLALGGAAVGTFILQSIDRSHAHAERCHADQATNDNTIGVLLIFDPQQRSPRVVQAIDLLRQVPPGCADVVQVTPRPKPHP